MDRISETTKEITINTGNLLAVNDISRKTAQNATDELCEALKVTYNDGTFETNDEQLIINPNNDDLTENVTTEERSELKIGMKLFVNTDSQTAITQAIEDVFTKLKIECIDNLILSYNHKLKDEPEGIVSHLENLWRALETFVVNQKVSQIGLSDVDEETFRAIHASASVKPSIIQINLATCCVVPPSLQAFCKDNEVQLLTHSDPSEILPKESLKDIFSNETFDVNWVTRFLIHIKCRGVLTTKGYLVNLYRV